MKWIYLTIAVLAETIATSALKSSNGFTKAVPSLIVVSGYAVSFYYLALTLKVMPVGITYAVWSGIGIVLITIIGFIYFRQVLDAPAIIGIALILSGVLVISLFSKNI